MTYRVEDTALERVFELLAEEGFDGMSQALGVLLNEMMKVERSRHLAGVGQRFPLPGPAGDRVLL